MGLRWDTYKCAVEIDPTKNPELLGKQCPATGNPITIITGNKYLGEVDVPRSVLAGLELSRHYNALGDHATLLTGAKWQLNLDRSLSLSTYNDISLLTAYRPDGKQHTLMRSGDRFEPLAGGHDSVYSIKSGANITGWRYLDAAAGLIESYDAKGRLTRITDLRGAYWTITRADGDIVAVTNAFGAQVSLGYDDDHRLDSLTLPDGGQIAYGYDAAGNLSRVTYPDGKVRQYGYNEAGQTSDTNQPNALTSITDENGNRYITYTYDRQGRAIAEALSGGVGQYTLTYNKSSTAVEDPLGSTRTYPYQAVRGVARSSGVSQPGGSGCSAASSAITYDANGNVASRSDFSRNKTTYTYDLDRNLETVRVEAADTALARTISTRWHPDWRLETKRAEPKKMTTWVYNGQPDPTAGNALAACAPASAKLPDGQPIAVLCKKIEQATTDATGAAGFSATRTGLQRTTTWTYNGYGQVLSENGPRTDVADLTTYSYYADTTADHTRGDLAKVTNAAGHVTEYLAYDKNGRLLSMKDPNGLVTVMSYTPRGWLKTRQVGSEITAYDYDAVGQLKKATLPDKSWIGYDYDAAHRLTDIYDHLGNRISYILDAAGNILQENVKDPGGVLARTQSRVYDALGRLQNIQQPQ